VQIEAFWGWSRDRPEDDAPRRRAVGLIDVRLRTSVMSRCRTLSWIVRPSLLRQGLGRRDFVLVLTICADLVRFSQAWRHLTSLLLLMAWRPCILYIVVPAVWDRLGRCLLIRRSAIIVDVCRLMPPSTVHCAVASRFIGSSTWVVRVMIHGVGLLIRRRCGDQRIVVAGSSRGHVTGTCQWAASANSRRLSAVAECPVRMWLGQSSSCRVRLAAV